MVGEYRNTHAALDRARAAAGNEALPAEVRDAHRILAGTYEVELANLEIRRIARAVVLSHERGNRHGG